MNIKPCPFCGSKSIIKPVEFGDDNYLSYRVECTGIDNHVLDNWDKTEEKAIETWNKRVRLKHKYITTIENRVLYMKTTKNMW